MQLRLSDHLAAPSLGIPSTPPVVELCSTGLILCALCGGTCPMAAQESGFGGFALPHQAAAWAHPHPGPGAHLPGSMQDLLPLLEAEAFPSVVNLTQFRCTDDVGNVHASGRHDPRGEPSPAFGLGRQYQGSLQIPELGSRESSPLSTGSELLGDRLALSTAMTAGPTSLLGLKGHADGRYGASRLSPLPGHGARQSDLQRPLPSFSARTACWRPPEIVTASEWTSSSGASLQLRRDGAAAWRVNDMGYGRDRSLLLAPERPAETAAKRSRDGIEPHEARLGKRYCPRVGRSGDGSDIGRLRDETSFGEDDGGQATQATTPAGEGSDSDGAHSSTATLPRQDGEVMHHLVPKSYLSLHRLSKGTGRLQREQVALLKGWVAHPENWLHPYPTEADKARLACEAGLKLSQVSDWFRNERKRTWLPLCRVEGSELGAAVEAFRKACPERVRQSKVTTKRSFHQAQHDKLDAVGRTESE